MAEVLDEPFHGEEIRFATRRITTHSEVVVPAGGFVHLVRQRVPDELFGLVVFPPQVLNDPFKMSRFPQTPALFCKPEAVGEEFNVEEITPGWELAPIAL